MNYYLETSAGEASVRYELSSSRALVVQARAGEQYRVVSSHGEPPDNVVAVRTETDLEVRLDNGVHLIIEDYYVVCRNDFCGISLSEEGVSVTANRDADRLFTGDNTIVYSHGSLEGIVVLDLLGAGFVHEPLKEIAQPASSMADDVSNDIDKSGGDLFTSFPLYMTSLTAAGFGLIAAYASSEDDSPAPSHSTPELPNNDAPVFTSGSGEAVVEVSVNEGEQVVYRAEATDADGDTLTYSLSGIDAALFTIDPTKGEVSFIDAPDYGGPGSHDPYDITIIAMDSHGLSANQNIIITVNDVNESPVFTSGSTATIDEHQTAAYTAVVMDPDGDVLTYRLGGADAALFHLDVNTGELTFKDALDYENLGANHPCQITRDDGGKSCLTLNLTDVLNLSDRSISSDTLLSIDGSEDDSVRLSDSSNGQSGRWVMGSEADTWAFRSSGGEVLASVLVDNSIDVII